MTLTADQIVALFEPEVIKRALEIKEAKEAEKNV